MKQKITKVEKWMVKKKETDGHLYSPNAFSSDSDRHDHFLRVGTTQQEMDNKPFTH